MTKTKINNENENKKLKEVVLALKRETNNLNNDPKFTDGCKYALELLKKCNI